jgi:group II intron reverse transcriptase/maturase
MERRCPYPRRSAGRALRQAATANPQKSADAIVAETLKLVGLGEGQNLTKRATTLDYPMKERTQKTMESFPQNDSAERESYEGAQTLIGMVGDDLVEVQLMSDRMLEYILTPDNLNRAYRQVKANKGSGGIDKMDVEHLLPYLRSHKVEIVESLLDGKFRPNPVRRVEIPKDGGKMRQLGIPTVVDRVIQQAIAQVLGLVYEPKFSDGSYGFRPGRSAHQALRRAQEIINDGYKYCIDLDLEKFFDTVNQSKLVQLLSDTIKDGRVVSLIHKYLRAGVMIGHKFEETEQGVPQGGPLSPLLSNIMLNELDRELERRGLPFVRYADDCIIFCKSPRAAERVCESISRFIEKKLFLKVNREKTHVGSVNGQKYLGYSFYT